VPRKAAFAAFCGQPDLAAGSNRAAREGWRHSSSPPDRLRWINRYFVLPFGAVPTSFRCMEIHVLMIRFDYLHKGCLNRHNRAR